MRKRFLTTAITWALLAAAPAQAAIIAASVTADQPNSGFVFGAPNGAVGSGQINDNRWFGFNERTNLALSVGLATLDTNRDAITIAAGTVVNIDYLAWDPDSAGRTRGTITFDGPILGIITTRAALLATDAQFGAAGVSYGSHRYRGTEGAAGNNPDYWSFSGNTLTFDLYGIAPEDFRVITAAAPAAAVPVPSAGFLLATGLGAFGAARRR